MSHKYFNFYSRRNTSETATRSQIINTYHSLTHWQGFQFKLFWEGIVVGIFSGLMVSLFRFSLVKAETWRVAIYEQLAKLPLIYTAGWFAFLLILGWVLYRITKYEPMAGGSGIPQVKGVILGIMRMHWFRILWVKITAGVIGLGAGLSLGREGPSIQLGAVSAQGISRFMGRSRMEERYLITSGASAGLAAAFNAPLAGVIFALEELHRSFSAVVLLPAMTAAMTATFISRLVFGRGFIFSFYGLPPFPQDIYLVYAVITAVIAGIFGVIFNAGLLNIHKFYKPPVFKNQYIKIAFSLLCAGILGFTLPQVLGGGNQLVDDLASSGFPIQFLFVLLAGKFLFTLISYGTGVPGGFFLPMLVLGALVGSICAYFLTAFNLIAASFSANIIVIAMAAFFAASVRAPITGTVLISEMTGGFSHLMILGMASAIAYIVAQSCGSRPIYEALLLKSMGNHHSSDSNTITKERTIVEVLVSSGSLMDNKKTKDIPWPPHTLVVDVKRGNEQIIPDKNTQIRAGDFLYVLTETESTEKVRSLGFNLQEPK